MSQTGWDDRCKVSTEKAKEEGNMSLGGILILALIVAVVVIGMKVRKNSVRLQELDDILGREIDESETRRP
jgi:hypothetical protein